jgi:hypothetical protein
MFCGCACVCWMGTCSTHLDEWQLRDPELLGVPPECQLEDFAASRRRLGRVGSEEEVPCRQPWMELQAAPLAVGIAHDHAFDLVCIDAEAALRQKTPRRLRSQRRQPRTQRSCRRGGASAPLPRPRRPRRHPRTPSGAAARLPPVCCFTPPPPPSRAPFPPARGD